MDLLGISWTESPTGPEHWIDSEEADDSEASRKSIKETLGRMMEACDFPIVEDGKPETYWSKEQEGIREELRKRE